MSTHSPARASLVLGLLLAISSVAHAAPPDNYEIVPKKLIGQLGASSIGEGHAVARLRDGRTGTAWRSQPADTTGVTIEITYTSPRHVAWLTLFPGVGSSDDAFAAVARPTEVTLTWEGGEQRFTLADARRQQDLIIKGLARITTLKLRIDKVAGPTDAGVAISEIAAYEPYEIISVKKRRRMKMTDAVHALRVQDAPDGVRKVIQLGERVIPWLVAEIKRGELLSGLRAFQALRGIDRNRAWRVAFNTLGNGEADSAVIAARFVADADAKDLADAVHGAFERLSGEPRLLVLGSLAGLQDPRALTALMAGVRTGDAALSKLAGAHLGAYGDDAIFELVALAGEPNQAVRVRAVTVLIALGGPGALQTLCDLANGPDVDAGNLVMASLAKSDSPLARAALIHLASQAPGPIRDTALAALTAAGPAAIGELIRHASGADPATSARVSDALGRLSSAPVRAALVEVVLEPGGGGPDPQVIGALSGHGKAGVQAVLDGVVARPDRAPAARAFLMKTYATSASVLASSLAGLAPGPELDPVRFVILDVIAHAQYVRAADQVAVVFRAPGTSKEMRLAVLKAVAVLPAEASREVAREALAHADSELSAAGLDAAIRLGDQEAGEILVTGLQAMPVTEWPMTSIEALARLKTRAAVAAFRGAMSSATKPMKLAMLKAAKRIGGKDATRFLVETSMAGEAEVSRTASQLLRSR